MSRCTCRFNYGDVKCDTCKEREQRSHTMFVLTEDENLIVRDALLRELSRQMQFGMANHKWQIYLTLIKRLEGVKREQI